MPKAQYPPYSGTYFAGFCLNSVLWCFDENWYVAPSWVARYCANPDVALRFTPVEGNIRVDASFDADGLRLVVTDTGCGIPENRLADLQEPFVQISTDWQNHSEGAGLGLTYVRNMARCHGGGFDLESVVDQGTTAILTLPT